ncbi:bifunctional 2-keto-4-hydroxyglutarate aldolase/2-keto-3-deoxy-6-phosphogluconate aldolase [Pseudogracilibacillus sp. ICA-222130]|uniref:bifunctional 2-keto-4-hydroxyglutarate aldolase/2-keto-3-deoxy-6-phosphogluconate aldolase n=1 Tax=Pseudogracilibacillus sp. ICA-222130 TaxID=3134655 RepID=UPI0030BC3528
MLPKYEVLQQLQQSKVVAVIRGNNQAEAVAISEAAIKGGFHAIEVTYTTPNASDVIKILNKENALVGAGTVLDAETARDALLHGAKFIVSPHFSEEISKVCNRYAVPYLPGCLTIKEMVTAYEYGCDVIKLFPANNFESSFIKAVNGPLPHVRIMPTGGIHVNNFTQWLDDGAFAVGIGSDLTKAFKEDGAQGVMEQCKKYLSKI